MEKERGITIINKDKGTINGVLDSVSETLLIKYMRHVRDCEGIDFVEYINSYKSDVIFTDEEEQTLIEYSSR
jgi:hypothetical protein